MPSAVSVSVGVNQSHAHSCCPTDKLYQCEAAACTMSDIAKAERFTNVVPPLLGSNATLKAVQDAVVGAKAQLTADGDMLLLSFAGHGCRTATVVQGARRFDLQLCLADATLGFNDLSRMLTGIRSEVRVVLVADCCRSGQRAVGRDGGGALEARETFDGALDGAEPVETRQADANTTTAEVLALREEVTKLKRTLAAAPMTVPPMTGVAARVILLASCAEDEPAEDGQFTKTLLSVWNNGQFEGGYQEFISEIAAKIGNRQTPGWAPVANVSDEFRDSRPFDRGF